MDTIYIILLVVYALGFGIFSILVLFLRSNSDSILELICSVVFWPIYLVYCIASEFYYRYKN